MKLRTLLPTALAAVTLMLPVAAFATDYSNYTVRPGDSWQSIASSECRQGTQAAALASYNGTNLSTPPRSGSSIKVPNSLSNQRSASIQSFQGAVSVNGSPVRNGMSLSQGAQIETGANSRADVMLDNGSVMRVGPSTRISLSQLSMNGRDMNTSTSLQNGSVSMQVTRLNRGSSFNVNTVSAVAGVRGTYFYISYDEATHDVGVACYSGRVIVGHSTTDAQGNQTVDPASTVNVDEGHATTINGASGAVAQPFPIPGRIEWVDEAN